MPRTNAFAALLTAAAILSSQSVGAQADPKRYDADCVLWSLDHLGHTWVIHGPTFRVLNAYPGRYSDVPSAYQQDYHRHHLLEQSAYSTLINHLREQGSGRPTTSKMTCIIKGTEASHLAGSINGYLETGVRNEISVQVKERLDKFLRDLQASQESERRKLIEALIERLKTTPPAELAVALEEAAKGR